MTCLELDVVVGILPGIALAIDGHLGWGQLPNRPSDPNDAENLVVIHDLIPIDRFQDEITGPTFEGWVLDPFDGHVCLGIFGKSTRVGEVDIVLINRAITGDDIVFQALGQRGQQPQAGEVLILRGEYYLELASIREVRLCLEGEGVVSIFADICNRRVDWLQRHGRYLA